MWDQIWIAICVATAAGLVAGWSVSKLSLRTAGAPARDVDAPDLLCVEAGSEGLLTLSRAARAAFGLPAREVEADALTAIFPTEPSLAQRLDELRRRGAPFRLTARCMNDRVFRVSGEARGRRVLVSFQDVTSLNSAETEAREAAAAAQRDAERARAALDVGGELSWIEDAQGVQIWSTSVLGEAPAALCEDLRTAAAGMTEGDMAVESVDESGAEATFVLLRRPMPDGETLFVATPVDHGEDAAFNRFVNTMSETFAHLKTGLMIFDQDRRLILFNPATVRLFNADAAVLARRPMLKSMLDEMRENQAIPEQSDYVAWRDDLLERVSVDGGDGFDENWHLIDGRTIHILARPHPSGGLAVTAEDITDTIALQRVNATERAFLNAAVDFLEEGLIVFGPDGRSRVCNAAFLTLWNLQDKDFATPLHIREVASLCGGSTATPDYWQRVIEQATGGGTRRAVRTRLTQADGRTISARFSPMPDGSSLLVYTDVTASERVASALRERNEALEHADEMRGALVDQISHQMRTPLNAVFGFGQLLSDERFGPLNDRQTDYVSGILSSSTELLDAINGMTDLITVGSETMSLGGESLDPAAVAREVTALAERRFAGRGYRIERRLENAPVSFRTHRVRLRQIVFNLLMDALGKASDGGKVVFELAGGERELRMVCRHDAIEDAGEAGLSVALIRRFTGLYGGDLTIETEASGQRVLTCRLPETETPPHSDVAAVDPSLAESAHSV